jgi:alkanesulfonate monooxygenase SsuD/methylene tetrahydromethanopterin reductase-like flavin-dependent oxidoreductase (luciferase family)
MGTLSVNLSYGRADPRLGSAGLYDEMVEIAKCADRLGFHRVWLAQHHGVYALQLPSPLIAAAQLSQHVSCRIGTASLVLPYQHPLAVAGEVGAVDQITGGRLDVGVCRGAYPYEFKRFGVPIAESKAMMMEHVAALDLALTSEVPEPFAGQYYSYEPTLTFPRPVQQPRPPIWVSAMSQSTIEWAVSQRYNILLVQFLKPLEHVLEEAEIFHRQREKLGLSRNEIKLSTLHAMYASEDDGDLRAKAEAIIRRHRVHSQLNRYDEMLTDLTTFTKPAPVADEATVDEVIERTLVSHPEGICARIQRLFDAGIDDVQMHVAWGLTTEQGMRSMELFRQSVMPKLVSPAAADVAAQV